MTLGWLKASYKGLVSIVKGGVNAGPALASAIAGITIVDIDLSLSMTLFALRLAGQPPP